MLKLTEEEAHDYFCEDYDEETSPFEVIEADDWDVGHKEDSCAVILLHKEVNDEDYILGAFEEKSKAREVYMDYLER